MIKCVIFDLDDTLFLTEEAAFKLENHVAGLMGYKPMSRAAHRRNWGAPLPDAIRTRIPGINADEFMRIFGKTMPEFVKKGLIDQLSDENLKLLDDLRSQGLIVLILTSRTHSELRHLLSRQHDLYSRIEAFYYDNNLQFTKPDPRVFDVILQNHQLRPKECVYIGDSVSDAECAKSRGLHFIASLESEFRREDEFDGTRVDAFINKLTDVPNALRRLDSSSLEHYWNQSASTIPEGKDPSAYALDRVGQFGDGTVCDLGGGSGADALFFAERKHDIELVDLSPAAITRAKRTFDQAGLSKQLRTHLADLNSGQISLKSASCEVVYSRLALHYLKPDTLAQLLGEIYRVLKPGGKAFLTLKSPDDAHEMAALKRLATEVEAGVFSQGIQIKTRLSTSQLHDIVKSAGFGANEWEIHQYTENLAGRNDKVKSGAKTMILNEIQIHKEP